MEYRRCQLPCARFIVSDDPLSKCVKCLWFSHAREAVYGISKCKFCENLRLRTLRSRLEVFEKESSVFPRRGPPVSPRPGVSDVELEAKESEQTGLAFSLPLSPEHVHVNSLVEFAHDYLYPSPEACDTVSFGLDDILLTAASDSEDFGPDLVDNLPPSGQEAQPSAAYSELVDVLSRATEKLSLDWPDEPRESQASKLDERFLSGPNSRPERRKLPFFSDLHQEISRSWKQPFSSHLTYAAAADFTNLVGSVEQGYAAIPVVEDTLASHLSPSLVPSWKSRPLLPTKPCRTTSALIRKSYIVAGQAGMALHTIAIFQAYQADVLKEMDEGIHSGSAAPEPFPLQREVQDADDEDDHVSDSGRGLVCLYRPKGCIFSHPGRPATQEVPSVCLLEGRLTNTRSFPSAWPWHRERSQSAWMLHWPPWGSRAFVFWIT